MLILRNAGVGGRRVALLPIVNLNIHLRLRYRGRVGVIFSLNLRYKYGPLKIVREIVQGVGCEFLAYHISFLTRFLFFT